MSNTPRDAQATESILSAQVVLDDDLQRRIAEEVNSAADSVKSNEEDAEKKGVTLKLTGARYRIYDTQSPEPTTD